MKTQGGRFKIRLADHGLPTEYLLLILSAIFLLLGFVIFWILPPELPIKEYRTPVISFLTALVVAAVGNIIIGFIQKGVSREAARALQQPIKELRDSIDDLQTIQSFFEKGVVGVLSCFSRKWNFRPGGLA